MTAPSLPGRTDPSLSGGDFSFGGGGLLFGGDLFSLGGDSFFSLEGDSDGGRVELVCVSDFFSGTDFPVPVACWLPGGDLLGQQTVDQQSQHTWQLQGREGQ